MHNLPFFDQPSCLPVLYLENLLQENHRSTIHLPCPHFTALHNPYWLWDVGFQLSYAAVLSIVIFMQPIYNWFYIKNKLLDFFWKLNAVTMAAQILTVPVSIYHFHQFPNYFLFTNFVAVPLSSLILIGEILLCTYHLFRVAAFIGKFISWLIWIMNSYIERIEMLPFSLWDGFRFQFFRQYFFVSGCRFWLLVNGEK